MSGFCTGAYNNSESDLAVRILMSVMPLNNCSTASTSVLMSGNQRRHPELLAIDRGSRGTGFPEEYVARRSRTPAHIRAAPLMTYAIVVYLKTIKSNC